MKTKYLPRGLRRYRVVKYEVLEFGKRIEVHDQVGNVYWSREYRSDTGREDALLQAYTYLEQLLQLEFDW